jgi:hypothetical protein
MIEKKITYVDYNGTERTETHYFNLSKAEILDMELFTEGGFVNLLERLVEEQNQIELVKLFKELVLKSYGVKSDDGRRFIKSEEQTKAFTETEAFSELYLTLAQDAEAASEFAIGIMPKDLQPKNGDVKRAADSLTMGRPVDIRSLAAEKLGK